jgi:hypothetical protein
MLKQLDVLIGFAVAMSIVSMLVMVLSQMILSGLQLRGRQMMYALEAMFRTLKPDLGVKAKALAEAVLRHPVISDSAKSGDKRGLASAIRPEELLRILKRLAASAGDPTQWIGNKTLKHTDEKALQPTTNPPAPKAATTTTTTSAQQDATSIIETLAHAARDVLGILEEPDRAVTQSNEQLSSVIATLPESVRNNIQTLEAKAAINVQSTLQRLEKRFETVEDRAREWFATRAQQSNVTLAVCLVLGLQLDGFNLYRQLQSDDAYRSAVVGSAAAVQKQAQELKEHADNAAEAASKEAAAGEFNYWTTAADQVRKQAAKLNKEVPATGFQLFPAIYPKTFSEWIGLATRHDSGLSFNVSHLLGMAFFAALLSLGAPYWFNLLKTLTSFRPLLAQQIDKDKTKKQTRTPPE